MPEYPDITIYIERLTDLVKDQPLQRIRIANPFLLRTAVPPLKVLDGKIVLEFRRVGKRIVFEFPKEHFLVLHLMVAGRLKWCKPQIAVPRKIGSAAFDFEHGSLLLTEAGTQKKASLHLVVGEDALADMNPGGLEVMEATETEFRDRLLEENHTLKRSLTDPRLFSGIGNAYSDEILHRARLSPLQLTGKMDKKQVGILFRACKSVLNEWTKRFREEVGSGFPTKVTAFRDEMAAHGKYGEPCPSCGTAIQRIQYASNETNYCPTCQTNGKLLADRGLSQLLKKDWPKTLEELENLKAGSK